MSRLLLALSDADLARETAGRWKLAEAPTMPAISDLVELLITRYPAWIAEATCLARLPDVLVSVLRQGLNADGHGPGFGHAVLDHLERGSPAASHLADIVWRTASEVLAHWPEGKSLRVLVVGAANLSLVARLGPAVTALNGVLVVTDLNPNRIESARLSPFDLASKRVSMTDWDKAVDPGVGRYDLILCARALCSIAEAPGRLDMLTQALRHDGALLAAESAPNLFSDLVHGLVSTWWTQSANPDCPVGAILSDRDWRHLLDQTNLREATVQGFGKAGAKGFLISGVADEISMAVAAKDAPAQSIVIAADQTPDSQRIANLLKPRLENAARVVSFQPGHAASQTKSRVRVIDFPAAAELGELFDEQAGRPRVSDVVFVAASRTSPEDPVSVLSRQTMAIIHLAKTAAEGGGLRLWVVLSGAMNGVVSGTAPNPAQAALWAALRVISNEFLGLEIRCLDLDPRLSMDAAASRLVETIMHPTAERELRVNASGYAALRLVRGGALPYPNEPQSGDRILRLEMAHKGLFEGLHWRAVGRRPLEPNEIEIQVEATGLNFRDVMWTLGLLPDEALENGFTGPTIGMECAGVISAIGPAVEGFRVGDRVVAFAANGFASHIVADSQLVARVPDEISTESAATLPVAFFTAYYALVHLARLNAGETVLIHGGAGGVGLAALQIAKARGATVIATAGSRDRRALLHELGASHVFDSRSLAFVEDVSRVTRGAGVDVVLNSLAGEAMIRSLDCLKPFGRFLELGKRDYFANRHVGLRPFRNNLSYFGIDADQLLSNHRSIVERLFAELMEKIAAGELTPLPYRIFEAEDAAGAFRLMQRSGHIGKILVRPPRSMPQSRPTGHFAVNPRARYLIVGGLGGFGLATAQWLATKGAKHLVLMSRTTNPTADAAKGLAELKARGVRVELAGIDVGDRAALERYLLTLERSDIPLKGVFHAAMVIDDGFAKDLDRSRIEKVLWPKVAGAANLDQLTRRFDLDCFVLFSSATVLVGNIGQTSYVAANAFLEGLAQKRRAEGLPGLAVGWGAIRDVGYLARNSAAHQTLEKRLGRSAFLAAEALVGLEALLKCDDWDVNGGGVAYARFDWSLVRKELAIARTPLFNDLQLDDAGGDGPSLAAEELLNMLRELPEAEVQAKIGDLIAENITRTLQLPAGDIDRNRPLAEFGMDSLMMLELRVAVEEQIGIEIPLMSLTSSLTVVDISKRLTAMLRDQEKSLMSGQMSALTQGHIEVPDDVTDTEVAATAAAVARRAKAVDRIL